MNDAMDAGMDGVGDEEEADKIYGQICDEIGVDINEEQQVNKNQIKMGGEAGVAVSVEFAHSLFFYSKVKVEWMTYKRDLTNLKDEP